MLRGGQPESPERRSQKQINSSSNIGSVIHKNEDSDNNIDTKGQFSFQQTQNLMTFNQTQNQMSFSQALNPTSINRDDNPSFVDTSGPVNGVDTTQGESEKAEQNIAIIRRFEFSSKLQRMSTIVKSL